MSGRILVRRLWAMVWFCLKNTLKSLIEHRDLTNARGYLSGLAALRHNLRLRKEIQAKTAVAPEYIRSLMRSKEQMLRETATRAR